MSDANTYGWGTNSEISYLNTIGSSLPDEIADVSRIDLIKGYIQGANARQEWGKIERRAVIAHAHKLLVEIA